MEKDLITSDHGLRQAGKQSWKQPHCPTCPAAASPSQYRGPDPWPWDFPTSPLLTRASERKRGSAEKRHRWEYEWRLQSCAWFCAKGFPHRLICSSLALHWTHKSEKLCTLSKVTFESWVSGRFKLSLFGNSDCKFQFQTIFVDLESHSRSRLTKLRPVNQT